MTIYRIDPKQSTVSIAGRSSLHPIHSRADGLTGTVDLAITADGRIDLTHDVVAHVEFPVNRLRSGNPLEQRELHRRIEAKRFPVIAGDVTTIAAIGDGNEYEVGGTVMFRGVAQPHTDRMTIERRHDGSLRFAGTSTFDVRDYGMEPPKILMLKVEPIVEIRVEIVAR